MAVRTIIFRGKRIDNGEWIEGYITEHTMMPHDLQSYIGWVIECKETKLYDHNWYEVDPVTVGQYTGLKDKNGKRIFEGDIVEYNDNYDYFKGKVVFELGAFGIGNSEVCQAFIGNCDNFASLWDIYWEQEPIDAPELYYCTIVGNIHDNPELLEVR